MTKRNLGKEGRVLLTAAITQISPPACTQTMDLFLLVVLVTPSQKLLFCCNQQNHSDSVYAVFQHSVQIQGFSI